MDGDVALGDSGLTIKGVKKRAKIGYLTHLEALQLCQVGSFLKIPVVPVWVIGSTSHFTVLFCTDRQINEESESDKLQTRVQRAFKSVDSAECGFIVSDSLPLALMNIEEPIIYELLVDEEEVSVSTIRAASHLLVCMCVRGALPAPACPVSRVPTPPLSLSFSSAGSTSPRAFDFRRRHHYLVNLLGSCKQVDHWCVFT